MEPATALATVRRKRQVAEVVGETDDDMDTSEPDGWIMHEHDTQEFFENDWDKDINLTPSLLTESAEIPWRSQNAFMSFCNGVVILHLKKILRAGGREGSRAATSGGPAFVGRSSLVAVLRDDLEVGLVRRRLLLLLGVTHGSGLCSTHEKQTATHRPMRGLLTLGRKPGQQQQQQLEDSRPHRQLRTRRGPPLGNKRARVRV